MRMGRLAVLAFVLVSAWLPAGAASADQCSEYERRVFALVDEAQHFQHTEQFRDLGWSQRSPYRGWLDEFESVRDDYDRETNLAFWREYGFFLTEVWQVAFEYLTVGHLDSFYQGLEDAILSAERCEF